MLDVNFNEVALKETEVRKIKLSVLFIVQSDGDELFQPNSIIFFS